MFATSPIRTGSRPRCLRVTAMIVSVASLAGLGCTSAPPDARLNIVEGDPQEFVSLWSLDRAFNAESLTSAGRLQSVRGDTTSEDILIGDVRVSHTIFRLSPEGRNKQEYRVQSWPNRPKPAHREQLVDFDVCPDGSLVVLSDQRLAVLKASGEIATQTTLPFIAWQVRCRSAEVLVYSVFPMRSERKSLVRYSRDLELIRSFHPFSERLALVHSSQTFPFAVVGNSLIVTEPFEARLSYYADPFGDSPTWSWSAGPNTPEFEALWSEPVDETREDQIINQADRFFAVFELDDLVVAWRRRASNGAEQQTWLIEPNTRRAVLFVGMSPLRVFDRKGVGIIGDRVTGSVHGALAIAFTSRERIQNLRTELADIPDGARLIVTARINRSRLNEHLDRSPVQALHGATR